MMQPDYDWSTSEVPLHDALSYWRDVVCRHLLELQIESAADGSFAGRIARRTLGPLNAFFISVSEQRVWRPNHGDTGREGIFHLIQVRRGSQLVEHRGHRVTLGDGDCVLIDCRHSFKFGFPDGVEALVLEVRRDWLKGWLPAPEDCVAKVFSSLSGWGATLSSALRNLTPSSIIAENAPRNAMAEQIAGLLTLAVGPADETLTTHKRALLRRVTEIIRDRCHEHELDATTVAAALRLSRRYMHVLFASSGTTFSQELYRCRLQRAQRVLCDRRFDTTGIGEIAWNCGFSGPSHFTRRFRESFGVAPSAYRSPAACEEPNAIRKP